METENLYVYAHCLTVDGDFEVGSVEILNKHV